MKAEFPVSCPFPTAKHDIRDHNNPLVSPGGLQRQVNLETMAKCFYLFKEWKEASQTWATFLCLHAKDSKRNCFVPSFSNHKIVAFAPSCVGQPFYILNRDMPYAVENTTVWITNLQDLKSKIKIKKESFSLVWGLMKKASGRALTILNHLNSMEMNMDVQCTPAAACLSHKCRRKTTNLNQAMQTRSYLTEFNWATVICSWRAFCLMQMYL